MSWKKLFTLALFTSSIQLVAGSSPRLYACSAFTYQDNVAARPAVPQSGSEPVVLFHFDGTLDDVGRASGMRIGDGDISFVRGLRGQALSLGSDLAPSVLSINSDELPLDAGRDFSVQFWVRTTAYASQRFVVLSKKEFSDNSLASQKNAGWAFYVSGGTWAWNMGSGERRIIYERDNGNHMPLNDGRWHQLTMTYSSTQSTVRLFYDGDNRVTYNVSDSEGFDFRNAHPLAIGSTTAGSESRPEILPIIQDGASQLQRLVDVFNGFGLSQLEPDDLVHLIVDPEQIFERKVTEQIEQLGSDSAAFRAKMDSVNWEPLAEVESELMDNPYTVHQVLNFMMVAPAMKIYSLVDGRVTIARDAAITYGKRERLDPPRFDMDDLSIWDRAITPDEVLASYSEHFLPTVVELKNELSAITAGCWNIWHGGKHLNVADHGLDAREVIADILEWEETDVVMMQETYSSGDFIAAELGYYFATTVDRDYLNQGSNISVLSRYPIKEIFVQGESPFMNVGARVAISETQDMYVMSNWYGMQQFPAVFEFHQDRFAESDRIPILFAGDFNAVPHTDGGDSPASVAMLDAGFTDVFRATFPDVERYPGHSHRSGNRIDQLYYKGAGLRNSSTKVVSTWPAGFPSDHYLIVSEFELDYSTVQPER